MDRMKIKEALECAKYNAYNYDLGVLGFGYDKNTNEFYEISIVYSIDDFKDEGINFYNAFYEGGGFGEDSCGTSGEFGGGKYEIINQLYDFLGDGLNYVDFLLVKR